MKNNRLTTLHSRHCTFVQCATTYCQADGLFFPPPPRFFVNSPFLLYFFCFLNRLVCVCVLCTQTRRFSCARKRARPCLWQGKASFRLSLTSMQIMFPLVFKGLKSRIVVTLNNKYEEIYCLKSQKFDGIKIKVIPV